MTNNYAFNCGYEHAKNGGNINNCYPFVKGNGYWDWLDGFRAYKNKFGKLKN